MVVLALLLLVVVVAVVVFVLVTGSTGTVELTWEQLNISFAPSPLVLFLLGAATLLLAVLALGMLRSGSRRGMAKRRELKRLRKLETEQSTATGPDGRQPVAPGAPAPHTGAVPAGQHAAPPAGAPPTAPMDVRGAPAATEPPKRL